jgi:type IV pilus assembly protein PilY1
MGLSLGLSLGLAPARAALTDLNDEPLATQSNSLLAPPNVMFIVDDSGSMDWEFMPGASTGDLPARTGSYGYKSAQCNGLAYDPSVSYTPPVKWNGVSYPQASYGAAWDNGYTPRFTSNVAYAGTGVTASTHSLGTKTMTFEETTGLFVWIGELLTGIIDILFDVGVQNIPNDLPTWANGTTVVLVQRNDSAYWMLGTVQGKSSITTTGICLFGCTRTQTFTFNVTFFTGKDNAANSDWLVNTPGTAALGTRTYYNYTGTEPKLGWSYTSSGALDGSTAFAQQCSSNIGASPGSGVFSAVTVNSASPAADQANYANWYQYYRSRLLLMKTASGRAFLNMPDTYRVGTTKISHSQYSAINGNYFLPVGAFTENAASTAAGQKFNFYVHLYNSKFYDRDASSVFNNRRATSFGTPLRLSLSQVGKYYANKLSGQTDPMTAACQRNYAILSTDGYWNDSSNPTGLAGAAIGHQDGSPEVRPMLDALSVSNTLADVAEYYYVTDIRDTTLSNCGSGTSLCTNDSTMSTDIGTPGRQNMVTYTLGLGVGSTLRYDVNYASSGAGDFAAIRAGTKSWPNPTLAENATRVDDVWHAAINGRGRYFSAQNATELSSSLESTIGSLSQTPGAGSAIASSAFQLSSSETNYVYAGSYVTGRWTGELEAFSISASGTLASTPTWTAQAQLDALANRNGRTAPASGVTSPQCGALYSNCNDERQVYFMHPTTKALTAFTYADLQAAGLDGDGKFSTACSASRLSQCSSLTADQKTLANTSKNLVNFLRGDATYETTNGSNPLFRLRHSALGDIANGTPAFSGKPPFQYTESTNAGYSDFVTAQASRTKVVYVAANDGMLHAFNATTGKELWAFVPQAVMPNLYKLADKNYSHQYFVDGSPVVADVKVGDAWKTILVGGLNKGGKAYYALDVTNPAAPVPLWEYTHTHLGYTYGNPVVTKNAAGDWIVAFGSGYNNSGVGYLFVLDAYTGVPKTGSPIATTAGDATTPSGLAPINAWLDSNRDNTARRIYAGDLLGNIWRFNIDAGTVAPVARLLVSSTTPQPITVRPELGSVTQSGTAYPVVLVGTGRHLHSNDASDRSLQSVYALRDKLDATGWGDVRAGTSLVSKSVVSSGSGTSLTRTATSNTKVDWATKAGWVFDLRPSSTGTLEGERVSTRMQVAYSTLVVAGNIPGTGAACRASGGTSWLYYFTLADGYTEVAPMYQGNTMVSGIGIVYDTTGRAIVITNTTDGETVRQTQSPTSPTASTGGLRRVSWRELVN